MSHDALALHAGTHRPAPRTLHASTSTHTCYCLRTNVQDGWGLATKAIMCNNTLIYVRTEYSAIEAAHCTIHCLLLQSRAYHTMELLATKNPTVTTQPTPTSSCGTERTASTRDDQLIMMDRVHHKCRHAHVTCPHDTGGEAHVQQDARDSGRLCVRVVHVVHASKTTDVRRCTSRPPARPPARPPPC